MSISLVHSARIDPSNQYVALSVTSNVNQSSAAAVQYLHIILISLSHSLRISHSQWRSIFHTCHLQKSISTVFHIQFLFSFVKSAVNLFLIICATQPVSLNICYRTSINLSQPSSISVPALALDNPWKQAPVNLEASIPAASGVGIAWGRAEVPGMVPPCQPVEGCNTVY